MSFETCNSASRGSNRYWFRRTRNSIARALTFCGLKMAAGGNLLIDFADWLTPWTKHQ